MSDRIAQRILARLAAKVYMVPVEGRKLCCNYLIE